MAPELVGALGILVCLVLILGAFLGAYVLGRDAERAKTELAIARAEAAEARAEKAEAGASSQAHRASDDAGRMADKSAAADADGVLDAVYDPRADPAAGEHGGPDHQGGTRTDEA